MPKLGLRPALDKSARGLPLSERHCVVKRRAPADDGSGGLEIGAGVDQRLESLEIVAARGPVQGRFAVTPDELGVHVRAGLDQGGDRGSSVRVVARPVGRHVQQSARSGGGATGVVVDYACRGEGGLLVEHPLQCLYFARSDRLDQGHGERFIRPEMQHLFSSRGFM